MPCISLTRQPPKKTFGFTLLIKPVLCCPSHIGSLPWVGFLAHCEATKSEQQQCISWNVLKSAVSNRWWTFINSLQYVLPEQLVATFQRYVSISVDLPLALIQHLKQGYYVGVIHLQIFALSRYNIPSQHASSTIVEEKNRGFHLRKWFQSR